MPTYSITEAEARELAHDYATSKSKSYDPNTKFQQFFDKYIGYYNEAMEVIERYNQSLEA